uniref:Threonylcarbamoyl-AMP synthase n=1 Tax=Globodera pallida TaxID=36090 RepID=A0A183BJJ0_GLOPA
MIRELLKLSTKQYKQLASLRRKIERKVMPGSNIRQLNPENVSQWGISVDIAADALLKGHVLAIPTDTLYGLVTLAEHSDKLYRIKRRHAQKPFGVFVDRPEDIKQYCVQTVPDEFLKIIYPGPHHWHSHTAGYD